MNRDSRKAVARPQKHRLNKKLYRAFSRQVNGLTLNIPVLQGLLMGRLKKMRKVDKWKIMNYKFESMKQKKSKDQ